MEITPFSSVGWLVFGDSRKDVRAKLHATFSTFRKGAGEPETDAFDEIGLHTYYDEGGRLEFVEAFRPADISFRGVRFLNRDVDAVTCDMHRLGFTSLDADVGVDFPDAGIVLTAPSGVVEGVAAHRKGYYD
jgi:hypothetical protein